MSEQRPGDEQPSVPWWKQTGRHAPDDDRETPGDDLPWWKQETKRKPSPREFPSRERPQIVGGGLNPQPQGSFMRGVGLVVGGHIVATLLVLMLQPAAVLAMWLGIGVAQLLWVGPLMIAHHDALHRQTAQGVVTAALVTFFLNAACWGIGLAIFAGPHH
ncbi:MAG: hypothetical protein AB7K09_07085 [Planctomycetota bacterium]